MKGKVLLSILILGISSGIFAQLKRARRQVRECNYPEAIELYYKSWKKDQFNDEIIREIGRLNLRINNYLVAERWYNKLYVSGYATRYDFYTYLKVLNYNDRKRKIYKLFSSGTIEEKKIIEQYFFDEEQLKEAKKDVDLQRVPLNTGVSAIFPAYYSDNRIVFMSDQKTSVIVDRTDAITCRPFYNFFLAKIAPKGNELVGDIELLSAEMESKFNDGPICFSKDGTEVFFSRNVKEKNKEGRKQYFLKLFYSKKKGSSFSTAVLLPFNEKGSSFSHPTLSADEKTLYFASDKLGSIGGTDIYKAEKKGDTWGEPVNLGDKVNTIDNEISPYMSAKGELYFSSRGLPGYGGYDLFVCNVNDSIQAQNLGKPINSSHDDCSVIIRGSEGYLSSNRETIKRDDIYYFYAHNDLLKKRPDVVPEKKEIVVENTTKPLRIGDDLTKTFNLKPILYGFNSSELTEDACVELDKVVEIMNEYSDMQLDLRSHSDSRGADWYNLKLSNARANSAIQYLRKRITSPFRVSGQGYGETQLLNHCGNGVECSDEEHAINRRTEFIVVKVR